MGDWVARLKGDELTQRDALVELGDLLKRRLAQAFRGDSKVDDSFIDDTVQDALTAILKSIDQFEGKSQFTTWATTLAVRTAIREMRRLRWKDTSLDQLSENSPGTLKNASSKDDPEAKSSSAQMIETMYRVIETDLSDKQREVLMAQLRGVDQQEIVRRMGSNKNAVYKLSFDARQKLKEGLEAAGYTAADLESFEV